MNIKPSTTRWVCAGDVERMYGHNEVWLRSAVMQGKIRASMPMPGSGRTEVMYALEDVEALLAKLTYEQLVPNEPPRAVARSPKPIERPQVKQLTLLTVDRGD